MKFIKEIWKKFAYLHHKNYFIKNLKIIFEKIENNFIKKIENYF